MDARTKELSRLSADSYRDRSGDTGISIDGVRYRILAHADHLNGYQGTVYLNVESNQIVVAHRGTEFDRQPVQDGGYADGSMALAGLNPQSPAAIALTERAMHLARERGIDEKSILVTGHSLGGHLAQVTAARFGLKAETFNAYGAHEMLDGPVREGTHIVNHMRATDAVAAANRHVGEVRVYATREDVLRLVDAGYVRGGHTIEERMLGVPTADAHRMMNFTDWGLISDSGRDLYERNRDVFDRFRGDVLDARMGLNDALTFADARREFVERATRDAQGRVQIQQLPPGAYRGVPGLLNDAGDTGPAMPAIDAPSSSEAERIRPDTSRPDARVVADLREDPSDPDNAMYQQACDGLRRMCDRHGFQPSPEQFDNTALQLVAAAKADPLVNRIDDVVPNRATNDAAAGTRLFAVSKPFGEAGPFFHVGVDAAAAARTPAEQSLRQLAQIERDAPALQRVQPLQEQAPRAPSLHLA